MGACKERIFYKHEWKSRCLNIINTASTELDLSMINDQWIASSLWCSIASCEMHLFIVKIPLCSDCQVKCSTFGC
jgi:hypothetical protein